MGKTGYPRADQSVDPGLSPIGPQISSCWCPPDVCLSDRPKPHRLGWAGVPVVAGGPTPPDVRLTDRPLPLRQGQQVRYASPRFLVRRCTTPIEVILQGVVSNKVKTEVLYCHISRYDNNS